MCALTVVWRPRTLTMANASAVPEVRVEGEADDDEELAHPVLAGEPDALVGLGVGRPHDAHGIGRVVDEELVEAAERGVLVGGGVRGCARVCHACRRAVHGRVPEVGGEPSSSAVEAVAFGPHGAAQYARSVAGDQRIDPRDAAFFAREDYHEVLARLRDEDPVHECAPGFWAVTRYGDIRDLSRDPEGFCSGRGALVNDPIRTSRRPMLERSILHMDPPEHAAFRGLVNRRFTPRALSGLAGSIRQCAARPARCRRGVRGDRLRVRAGRAVPPHGDRRAVGYRRGRPGRLPPLVRCGDRVARSASRRDDGGARGALGVHRRAHPGQARRGRGRTWCRCWCGPRSTGARSAGRSSSCSS